MSQWALITGASSGIGYELACQLAKENTNMVLTARRLSNLVELKEKIEAIGSSQVKVIALDLLADDSVDQLVQFVKDEHITLDLLINNAGFGDYGAFMQSDIKKQDDMIVINVLRLTQLTHGLLPYMNQNAQICNIGSLASFMPGPYMSVYYASKQYVLSFSLALQAELKSSKINVSTFCPGPVKTEFNQVASVQSNHSKQKKFKLIGSQSVEDAVLCLVKGLKKRKKIILSKPAHHLIVWAVRLVPHTWIGGIMAKVQKLRFEKE